MADYFRLAASLARDTWGQSAPGWTAGEGELTSEHTPSRWTRPCTRCRVPIRLDRDEPFTIMCLCERCQQEAR